jgi:hypothetical protein
MCMSKGSRHPELLRLLSGNCEFRIANWQRRLNPICVICAISGVDDLFGVSAARLLVHLFAAAIFVAFAGFVSRIYLPFLGEGDWGWLGVPITRSSGGGGRGSGCLAFSF